MTRRHPELVHALVLGEPAVGFLGEGATRDTAIARAAMTTSALDSTRARFIRGDSLGGMKACVDASGGDWDASPSDLKRYFLLQLLEPRKEMTAPSEVWIPPTSGADLRLLTMPVLRMEDERTIAVYHGIDQQIAGCLKGAKTAIVPGVGHMHTDNSPVVNQQMDDFPRISAAGRAVIPILNIFRRGGDESSSDYREFGDTG